MTAVSTMAADAAFPINSKRRGVEPHKEHAPVGQKTLRPSKETKIGRGCESRRSPARVRRATSPAAGKTCKSASAGGKHDRSHRLFQKRLQRPRSGGLAH